MGKGEIPSRVRIPTCPPEQILNLTIRPLTLVFLLAPALVTAQSLDEYLKLRKQHGITRAAEPEELEVFVGERVLEVKGTVKGVVGSGDGELLMVEGPNRVQHFVKSSGTPDWLRTGQVQARLLIQASRSTESSMLDARLLAAAGESEVASFDAKVAAKKKPSVAPLRGRIGSSTSRKGSRPGPMPGSVPRTTTTPVASLTSEMSAELARILPQYTAFIKNRNKKLSDAEAERIAQSVLAYSTRFGVDARLIMAIIICESGFDPKSTSSKGAMGLGQLMPVHVKGFGLNNGYDIEQNLWATVKLVRGHIDKYAAKTNDSFEALVLALAGYNAGNGAVKKYGGVPPYKETQNYIRKVIATYQQLCGQ